MKYIKYELQVTGNLWCGSWAEYTYALPANTERHPKTLKECKTLCGDFESLDTADIIRTEKVVTVSERAIIE